MTFPETSVKFIPKTIMLTQERTSKEQNLYCYSTPYKNVNAAWSMLYSWHFQTVETLKEQS